MSTGKRLAKRSIIGTRVCAPGEDGKFYSGIIHAVKTPASFVENNNCINLTPNTRYTVKFDSRQGTLGRTSVEFFETDLIGPGFRSVLGLELVPTQKCFVTYNGREVMGEVCNHNVDRDEVIIRIMPPGTECPFEVQKKMEEVRLLESRKSARLADQDQDFARLADMGGDRKRTASHTIDVPTSSSYSVQIGSRKRRPSSSQDDDKDPQMDECSAALVLMSLSCSPHSPKLKAYAWLAEQHQMSEQAIFEQPIFEQPIFEQPIHEEPILEEPPPSPPGSPAEDSLSSRSSLSPTPLSAVSFSSSMSDEGIFMDYLEDTNGTRRRRRRKNPRLQYLCTWPNCNRHANTCEAIEAHVRNDHLANRVVHVGEEEFYYNEVEEFYDMLSPAPTLSHRDMAKPPHEDPDYQRQLIGNMRQNLLFSGPVPIPQSPQKMLKLTHSARPHSPKVGSGSPVHRRIRGENKKCRKVYGMDHKEQWCTQCKWKKACTRFGD